MNKDICSYDINGKRHGYWELYYPNNKLKYKGFYKNGKEYGYWEMYFADGQLCSKGFSLNEKKYGFYESYWSDGDLLEKGYYLHGKKYGYFPKEGLYYMPLNNISYKVYKTSKNKFIL